MRAMSVGLFSMSCTSAYVWSPPSPVDLPECCYGAYGGVKLADVPGMYRAVFRLSRRDPEKFQSTFKHSLLERVRGQLAAHSFLLEGGQNGENKPLSTCIQEVQELHT